MKREARRYRLFFALWPEADAGEHLYALAGNLTAHALAPGRITPMRNMHMTLAFVGSVDEPMLDRIEAAAARLMLARCNVELDHVGFWPRGGVVYAGCVVSGALKQAFAKCSALLSSLDLPIDGRPPVPHVTLARNVRGIRIPRLGEPIAWTACEFSLVASELHPSGARYSTLASWPMSARDD